MHFAAGSTINPRDSGRLPPDRKSTRLNSSHLVISYAVFCLKKKKDRKGTRLNSSHLVISYAVFCFKKNIVFRRMQAAGAGTEGDVHVFGIFLAVFMSRSIRSLFFFFRATRPTVPTLIFPSNPSSR